MLSCKTEILNFNYLKRSVDGNENHAYGQVTDFNGQLALRNFMELNHILYKLTVTQPVKRSASCC
jgi:hypothetical protein